MPTLLDPKNDYVFKRLFADEPELLIALINAVRYRAPPIRSIRIRNPAIDPSELHGKYIMLDLLAEDSNGTRYNIEMQVRRQHAYGARSTYYLAKIICDQLVAGDAYERLCPVVGIHLLDFDLFRAQEHRGQAVWCFEMRDLDTPNVCLGDELQLNVIELKKAERLGQLPPALSAWVTLFEHWQEENIMSAITDKPTRRAYDKLAALSADEEARRLAFVRERALHDEAQFLLEAREEGRKEGHKEGRKEGHKEGRKEGHKEGQKKGRDDALRQTAANLIRNTGLDDASIATVTGLDIGEIAALRGDV
jgi:predicted transposase/invertase (TIGR01784 family)